MKKILVWTFAITVAILAVVFFFILKTYIDRNIDVKISLVGDMLFDKEVRRVMEKRGAEFIFSGYKEYMEKSDVLFGNLETPLTDKGIAHKDKQYVFRSKPEIADYLKKNNFTAVSIANNHILDYGEVGLLDTINYLKKSKVGYAGSGKDKEEAETPYIVEKKGLKIGFLAFTKVVPEIEWYAELNKPGVLGAYKKDEKERLRLIKTTKEKCDILIVSIHWGKEAVLEIREEDISFAHDMVDAGVDVVMGSHPHIVQQCEIYKEKPIFYSLGNFIFTNSISNERNKTVMAQVTFGRNRKVLEVKKINGEIRNCRPDVKNEEVVFKIKSSFLDGWFW